MQNTYFCIHLIVLMQWKIVTEESDATEENINIRMYIMVKETDSKQISTKVIKISRDCSKYSEENR